MTEKLTDEQLRGMAEKGTVQWRAEVSSMATELLAIRAERIELEAELSSGPTLSELAAARPSEAAFAKAQENARASVAHIERVARDSTFRASKPTQSDVPSREKIMSWWDNWRAAIAKGDKSSWPRDSFESVLDDYDDAFASIRAEGAELAKLEAAWQLLAEASVALSPFDAFADKATSFVDAAARAADDASPVMPTRHFRLADFQRAREVAAKIEAAIQLLAQPAESKAMPERGLECVMRNMQCFDSRCLNQCQATLPGAKP